MFMISGFRRGINEVCFLLGFYEALNGISLPTFRDKLVKAVKVT